MTPLTSLLRRLRRRAAVPERPEDYWPGLGTNVVGNLSREQMLQGRQADTYRATCRVVAEHAHECVADLGCNVGMLGVFLREGGYRGLYCGFDANPNGIAVATRNLGRYPAAARFAQANLRQIPLRDRAINVVLKDVLEHAEDFRPILGEALRVAASHAVVVNFIPWTEGQTIVRREPPGYYHNAYARRDVYAFIREQGFEVQSVTATLEADARPNEVVLLRRAS